MEALRTLLIAGHPELSERIHRLKGIEIIDEDDDPDVVIDILNYEDADLIIVNTLLSQPKSLKLALRAREKQIKVIALTDDKKSHREEISALVGAGVTAVAGINNLNEVQEYIFNYPNNFDYAQLADSGSKNENDILTNQNKTTIAVMGIMHRIGTTTQAIMLTKYLMDSGYRAAYIEMNKSGYVRALADSYEGVREEKESGKIQYQGIDMFTRPENIRDILDMPYTHYIYDFGSLSDEIPMSWMEKKLKIVVAGSKPQELEAFRGVIKKIYRQDPAYIFSFSAEDERNAILSQMGKSAGKTYFSDYCPDPFAADTTYFYHEILNLNLQVKHSALSKLNEKKGFFRRKNKKL